MDLGLGGKTALVLGASSGLGRAIAIALANEGARVAITGRRGDLLSGLASEIGRRGGRALACVWDLNDLDGIDAQVTRIERELGPIDILVNNTGGPPPTPAAGQPAELWSAQFRQMVQSVISVTDRVLPGMRSRGWGRIITSASSGIEAPISNLAISNALRLALVGWSKTLSREVAADGVTVNVVAPGRIRTDRIDQLDAARAAREDRTVGEVRADSLASIPTGRLGDPEEYAAVVAFLASRQAGYVTGAKVRVDGGMIASL